MDDKMRLSKFAKYALGTLLFNLIVILWGAFVRATGSGAGCGSHWPLCNGVVIPRDPQLETLIEFAHRIMSGLSLLLIVVLVIWAFRAYPRKHIVRLGASLSVLFIITEALVGAGLVLFNWVAQNASTGRVISMAIHLINTFLLLAALTLTAWWAASGETISFKHKKVALWGFGIGFLGVLVLGVSGAITALGDTLFPAVSLVEGMQQDFSPTAHFVLRLRVWHPIIAIIVGSYLFVISGFIAMHSHDELHLIHNTVGTRDARVERHNQLLKRFALFVISVVILQLLAGLINLLLLAPSWMQLIHLFLADMVWIGLVLLAANIFAKPECETVNTTTTL
jgi:heme A synthase